MTRLKNILLAGTLVPALVLPPTAGSWAQAPGGLERGGGGGAAGGQGGAGARGGEGGPHGGGAGAGGMGGPGARGGGEGGPHAGGAGGAGGGAGRAERAPRAERPEGAAGGGGAAGRAERTPGAGRGGAEPGEGRGARQAPAAAERSREPAAERHAPAAAERAAPPSRATAAPAERANAAGEHSGAAGKAETTKERAAERPNGASKGATTPAERATERAGTKGATTPAERATERGASPAERNAERPGAPTHAGAAGEHNAERPGTAAGRDGAPAQRAGQPGRFNDPSTPQGGGFRNSERPGAAAGREGGPGQPGRANDPSTPQGGGFRNGERPGAAAGREGGPGQPGRANDPSTPQGGGFRNGDNPRGNAAPGRGPDNRGFDNREGDRGFDNRGGDRGDRRGGISPGGAAAIGAAAGFAGGFLAATGARDLEGVRRDRREVFEDGRTYIREPGRTIVDEGGGRAFIVHDENDRFRDLGYDVRRERRGDDFIDTIDRPGGEQILTFTTRDGRMLRRVRRYRDGREVVLIDNAYNGGIRSYADDVVDLPPPRFDIPRDRYAVDYADADEGAIYEALSAPPVARPPRRYTLDQIRYSPDIRRYVRSVDINTINFASGSWIVPASATGKLQALGQAIKRAVSQNPNSVFLVEGFTDATGNPNDNLSLSDRRAQSVAAILSKDFQVPPENLTTQGYGQQNLKVNTQGSSAENRRVVVQNITQLMADNSSAPPPR